MSRLRVGVARVGVVALTAAATLLVVVPASDAAKPTPRLVVRTIATGLDHPWDVRALPGGRLIFTQRARRTLTVLRKGHQHPVAFDNSRILSSGEIGLMGLEVDPAFTTNRRIYTCEGWEDGGRDIRVTAWRLGRHYRKATLIRHLVTGLPLGSRHGGCRLLIDREGSLLVGTGDAARGTNPEDLTSLGGKVLRLDRRTGAPWPTNPFVDAVDTDQRYVYSYGHRNVQGLAQRADGSLWSVEQGTDRDDEVNLLVPGGDYGYNPVPGYDESVPMTDQSLPGDQVEAKWSSGFPTLATSGGTFLPRQRWQRYGGMLAVACLKAEKLLLLRFSRTGALKRTRVVLTGHGRLRTAVVAANGDLLVLTDNGAGRDVILRVRPR